MVLPRHKDRGRGRNDDKQGCQHPRLRKTSLRAKEDPRLRPLWPVPHTEQPGEDPDSKREESPISSSDPVSEARLWLSPSRQLHSAPWWPGMEQEGHASAPQPGTPTRPAVLEKAPRLTLPLLAALTATVSAHCPAYVTNHTQSPPCSPV